MNFYKLLSSFVGHFWPPGSGSGIRIHRPDWIRIQSGSGSTTLVPSYSIVRTLGAQLADFTGPWVYCRYPKKIIERDGIHKSTISLRFLILEFCAFIFVFIQNKLECTSLINCFMISETSMGIDSFFLDPIMGGGDQLVEVSVNSMQQETILCVSLTWETCWFTVPPVVALINYMRSGIF